MKTIDTLLKQLQKVGVHYIKSESAIILEILEDKYNKAAEIDLLINELITQQRNSHVKNIKLECPKLVLDSLTNTKLNMKIIGERIIYTNTLTMPVDLSVPDYDVWPISENNSISFLSEVMRKSYIDTENFLIQMNEELPLQAEKMYTVYKVNNEPVGVVFPHIEPHTDREGRMFWIGIHPYFIGKRMGKALHLVGLYRLKIDFNAKSYVGITQINNHAMKKIMISNGCIQNKHTLISLEYSPLT
ncbi:N-acetyltransferase [Solibacillus sp. CAU 1738]|uniref:N-acetyltransferase n=1 Tax=Solibacillus sp. CAU 1738 TaxID=3140363 RepID=UPI00325FEA60